MKPKRKGWTFRTARKFWVTPGLSLGAKGLAHILLSFANPQGGAWPTTPQLANAAGISGQTIEKFLSELRAAGLIAWTLWKDEHGQRRRMFDLRAIHIAPYTSDGLGGAEFDGKRTLMNSQD